MHTQYKLRWILGNTILPIITSHKDKIKSAPKVKKVKIQVEDHDLLNFITGGYL